MQPGFLEFFAGIGLVHLGLQASGWRCVYANDISEKKMAMYLQEMPDASAYYHCEDIWKTDVIVDKITEPALLATASFPCIDLSLAGQMKGLSGLHSSTFYGFIEVMKQLKHEGRMPACLLIENVTGLLTGNAGKDFRQVCLAAAHLGFYLDAFIVDAKHFTPQSRPRLFIIGMLESVLPPYAVRYGQEDWWKRLQYPSEIRPLRLVNTLKTLTLPTGWVAFDLPPLPPVQNHLASVIDLDEEQEWWDEQAVQKHLEMTSDLHRQRIEKMRRSEQLWIGTIFRRIREKKTRAEVRFDGLAGCLRTATGGSAKQIVIVINKGTVRMRWMSTVEYARLQGVPNFTISVPRNQALTGFADAVCVPVIQWIDLHIFSSVAAHLGFDSALELSRDLNQYELGLAGKR
ncbi:MAG: DNA cytosine methyltransferase [Acidobacteria bacterium]|nr:DNA cytosine methyltransferase [Acidobacteriota bacterium]